MLTGQKFFQLEDYESALEIYNFGIEKVCPNYASVWNNRAAVYLKIGNFHQAIKDATRALELLNPPVDSNALMRAKALIRRGMFIIKYIVFFNEIFVKLISRKKNSQFKIDFTKKN